MSPRNGASMSVTPEFPVSDGTRTASGCCLRMDGGAGMSPEDHRTIEPEGQRMTSNAAERDRWMCYEDILARTQRSHLQKHFSSKTTSFRLHLVRGHMPPMSTHFGRRVGLWYQNGYLFFGRTCYINAEIFSPIPQLVSATTGVKSHTAESHASLLW